MGFYPQPNLWQCGPFALKHALVMLGIPADENELAAIAGTRWWAGTDEFQLAKAARRFNCDLTLIRRYDPEVARRELVSYLGRGIPVLLCVQEWSHWVTAVKMEQGKFIILDSRKKSVLTIHTWRELKKEWIFHERDDRDKTAVQTILDFHPVVPRFRVPTKAKFSLARAKFLLKPSNRGFSRLWNEYLADLLNICRPRTPHRSNYISLGEFLRRHGAMIVDQVDLWHGWIERPQARRILLRLRFMADTYGLVLPSQDEKRGIAGITAILTLWAASEYGVLPVYRPAPRKRRR
ncbi:MAG TPA: hypothetical protein DEP53_00625 [Bacteroidetes bacterium]|nr:MAG: hypothetical protein A2X66_08315 [Ignavibacteria bacterium GWA2_54_16]HCA78215.1 hypothetical protein [Bacteroidota bacterium]